MERKGIYLKMIVRNLGLILFLFLFLPATNRADNSETLKIRFQKLFLDGRMEPWKHLVDSLRVMNLSEKEDEVLLYGEYGLVGYLIGKDQKKAARYELDKFEAHIARRLKASPGNATLHAFKAASVGFAIGLQPWKAIYLGSDNKDAVEKAIKYHKNEPLPLYEWANSLYYRPGFAGGNKKKATELFKKTLEIYHKTDTNNWMYLNTYTWLGQIYAKSGDKAKARKLYNDLLKSYPDYNWVKNELLPDLDSDMKRFRFLELDF